MNNPFLNFSEKDKTENKKTEEKQESTPFTNQVKIEEKNPKKKKLSIAVILVSFFIVLIAFVVLMIFILAIGGPDNPVLKAYNIDPYSLKENLQTLTQYSFLAISALEFVLLIIGVFLGLMTKKGDLKKRRNSFILSIVSFSLLFFTIIVWLAMYAWIDQFVVNAESPNSGIEIQPSEDTLKNLESPVEITISVKELAKNWQRKGKEIVNYAWDFNNDNNYEFNTQKTTFTQILNSSGETPLKLMIVFADNSKEVYEKFLVLPQAIFNYSPKEGYAPLKVNFDASNLQINFDNIDEYAWDFDNDNNFDYISSYPEAEFEYKKIGNYEVLLRVKTKTNQVEYFQGEIDILGLKKNLEEFKIKVTPKKTGQAPLSLLFEAVNLEDNNIKITNYEWNFGDGSLKEKGKSVNHTFDKAGDYKVVLKITDENNSSKEIKEKITVLSKKSKPKAVISLSPDKLTGKVPFEIIFSAKNSEDLDNNIVEYLWDFNNDQKIDYKGLNGKHIYREVGEYLLTLTVKDSNNNLDTVSKKIEVLQNDLEVILNSSVDSGVVPLTVRFDASSSFYEQGKIVSYEWDFGDGTPVEHSGALKTHRFTDLGEYEVKVTVYTDDNKKSSQTKKIYVRVPVTQACFTVSRDKIILSSNSDNNQVSLDSTCSEGNIKKWKWIFSDGYISYDRNLDYVFNKTGNYSITLEVIDDKNNVSEYSQVIEVVEE